MYDNSHFLSKQQMYELAETKEGRDILFSYFMSARIARAVQETFETLQIVPEPAVQTKVCNIIYDALFRVKFEEIMDYIESMKEIMDGDPTEEWAARVIASC